VTDTAATALSITIVTGILANRMRVRLIRDSAGVRGVVNGEDGRAIGDVELSDWAI
jgi:hypothetical protein